MIFFLADCKKEKKDTTSPLISISSPGGGQIFNMFDTMAVTAHVSDETKLTSVVVSLNDLNNIPVQNTIPITIQSKDFTFSIKYAITEYHLPSGFYNLSITANDGSNSHQSTKQVYINESSTQKTGYYIVGASLPKNIVKYNVSMIQQSLITLNTGFNGMAYGGYYNQLFVNGNINQSYQTYNAQTNTLAWSAPYGGGGLPQCMGVYSDGQKPYISYYSGYVTSYLSTGTINKNYINANTNYYATYFNMGSTYNAGIYKDKFNSGGDKIICFGKNSGIAVNSNFTPCRVRGIFEHTADEFYILGNDTANNAVLYLYTVSANIFVGPMSLPAGKLLSAAQIDSDYLVFASANGNIYGYRYSNGSALSLANVTAQKIFYHPKMLELTAACKTNLYVYSVSGNYALSQQSMQVLSDSIIGFEVVTNK